MDWAAFIKPTRWKIAITLLIPLYLTYTVQYAMAIPPAKSIWYQFVFYPLPLLFVYAGSLLNAGAVYAHPIFTTQERILHFIMDYITPALVNYLLVCALAETYSRKKTKKTQAT